MSGSSGCDLPPRVVPPFKFEPELSGIQPMGMNSRLRPGELGLWSWRPFCEVTQYRTWSSRSGHQQAVRGGCMKRSLVDPTSRPLADF